MNKMLTDLTKLKNATKAHYIGPHTHANSASKDNVKIVRGTDY